MIVYFKRSWEFCLSPTCHSWKRAWKTVTFGTLPPRKIQHRPPTSESPIYLGIQQISEKDREALSKLHNISFHIALQRLPFTAFQNQVALEKLHGVKFTGAYENEYTCKNFIIGISKYLFEEKIKKKLHLVKITFIIWWINWQ